MGRLTEEARRNETAWQQSQRRELALLEAEDLPTLLHRMTVGLRASFRLQAASLRLLDPDHEIRTLLGDRGRGAGCFEHVQYVDDTDRLAMCPPARLRPWLGTFDEAVHRDVFAAGAAPASVALLPLVRRTRVLGSLHLGSSDPQRFTRSHATDFLHHLACIAAVSLESSINAERLVQRQSLDALTGWHNRRYLQTRLREELARSQRDGTSLVCLMLDIDHFKRVNDEHGHLAGDTVLRETAARIGSVIRDSDIAARYGGEEFIVLMPQTGLEAGGRLAERIRGAVSGEAFCVGERSEALAITVSIGLAEFSPDVDARDPDAAATRLVGNADRALYEAKAAGRNLVVPAAA
jgi:diguanylate cyclase (GGDEF)-like protein